MNLIKLDNVTKQFDLNNKEKFTALKDISLVLPNKGLVSIVGKSGCGKSTLLNILAGLDNPTSGRYIFNGDDMSNLTQKEKELFLNKRIGMVFQHYYLLEDFDVMFNIILPLLISGTRYTSAVKEAKALLDGIGFKKDYHYKKVKDLSGGEKQRVAILRSLITAPNVILADEPTGALDSENSIKIMEILRKVSNKKLVIIVSHNKELVSRYSDYIVEMKDGEIINRHKINKIEGEGTPITFTKMHKGKTWVERIALSNLRKRFFRNIVSILSLAISLVATTLVIGFSKNATAAISKEGKKRIDYGVLTIAKEESFDLSGTLISLVQQSRPSIEKVNILKKTNNKFKYTNNYDILMNMNSSCSYFDNELDDLLFRPIYNFSSPSFDHSLLLDGNIPPSSSFQHVLINKKALELLKKSSKLYPINQTLRYKSFYESSYYTFDEANSVINDTFVLNKDFTISGVVDELDFLSTPIVYYSYEGFIRYLSDTKLNNLSSYYESDYTWKDRIDNVGDGDDLSSYSIRAFLKDYHDNDKLSSYISSIKDKNDLTATSLALTVEDSLTSLVDAASKGMSLFLIIAIIGVTLIIGILSFFSYTEDHRSSAILSSLGASHNSIVSVYLFENVLVGLLSYILSILLSFPFIKLADYLLNKYLGLNEMISFPYYLLSKFKIDYLLLLLIGMLLVVALSTFIPIKFSKKISISKELRDE